MPFIPIRNSNTYLTQKEVAEALGIKAATLQYRVQVGNFPAPTHQPLGSVRKYYVREDLDRFLLTYGKEVE